MKLQPIASAITLVLGGVLLTQTYAGAAKQPLADETFKPTRQQILAARQVSTLLNRSHYLNKQFDGKTSQEILDGYLESLDSNRTLFLQSDIDEFNQNYGNKFGKMLQRGDLSAGFKIFQRYLERNQAFYHFASDYLAKPVNLYRDDTIIVDREDQPYFTGIEQQQNYWAKQLTLQLINLTIGQQEEKAKDQVFRDNPELTKGIDLIKDEKRTPSEILQRRLSRQHEQLGRVKSDKVLEAILNAAMGVYDPHSNYYAPIQATEMNIQSNLELEGIGVSIRPDRKNPDYTRIETIVDGGPAAKSGQIHAGEFIIGVAQAGESMVDVVGWSVREVVGLIRGKRGTDVIIRVKKPGTPDSSGRNVTITRDVIKQEESGVQQRTFELKRGDDTKKIGVLEIPSFYLNYQARRNGEDYRSVSVDTETALKALNAEHIDGLVVDLRNNPGGSLEEVAKMLGLFIKQGSLVQIRDNRGNIQVYKDKDGGKQLYRKPMVVLVNLASASASEIFAAAIQDYNRGLIVGSTTTGKGSAQIQLDSLAYGQATLTQRKFYRITGGSTQNKGVVPDIDLVNIYDDAVFGERAQKNPLKWDTIKTAPYKPEGNFADELAGLKTLSYARQKVNPQFIYLNTLNDIRHLTDDKKPVSLNLGERSAYLKDIEAKTLQAENERRLAMGKKPYTSWDVYQADLDAQAEVRSKMKENERPPLPEEEAFVKEAATIMLDEVVNTL